MRGLILALLVTVAGPAFGQTATLVLQGVVQDPTALPLPGATVELRRPGQAARRVVTGPDGTFEFRSITAGGYSLAVTRPGFKTQIVAMAVGDVAPARLVVTLAVAGLAEQVIVQSVSAPASAMASPVTRETLNVLASENPTAGLSAVVTLSAPGVAADSNGGFHPLGEHAETAVVVDGQPITDQQSRTFSNQLSTAAIEAVTVDTGVPPAEFGGKTSLVANITTRSGLDFTHPAGTVSLGYGSFDAPTVAATFGARGRRVADFATADAMSTRRFLDAPETVALHDRGDLFEAFDRFDVIPASTTAVHLNTFVARSAFETPNTFDQASTNQDQRQRQRTVNIAPALTYTSGSRSTVEVHGWIRRDTVTYAGSADPFADQPATLSQHRTLTNAGGSLHWTRVAGSQTIATGLQIQRTWLAEAFFTGLTDPAFNSPCESNGVPVAAPTVRDPDSCAAADLNANPSFLPALLPYDLTRGGTFFQFSGTARIDEGAAYAQDALAHGPMTVTAGVRLDVYRGLSRDVDVQPRVSATYRVARTHTVWRASYGRIMLTPYNENLVLASSTGSGGFGGGVLGSIGGAPLATAHRQQVDAGVQQTLWHGVQIDGEYFWKRTTGAYDFDVILNTPLAFPVQFARSQIGGGLLRVSSPTTGVWHWYATVSHSRALLYGPELGGLRFTAAYAPVAQPDHDEPFQANAHVEFRPKTRTGFWAAATWRYDSGLVAVAVPTYAAALSLTGDEQAAMGLYCGGVVAGVTAPLRSCTSATFGATRIDIPPAGTENDATNPPRIVSHTLTDVALGFDALRVGSHRVGVQITVSNVFNTIALYNFLSTFSGTHFVAPRALGVRLTYRF